MKSKIAKMWFYYDWYVINEVDEVWGLVAATEMPSFIPLLPNMVNSRLEHQPEKKECVYVESMRS